MHITPENGCTLADGSFADVHARAVMLYVNIPFCRSKCAFCDYVQPIPASELLLKAGHSTRQGYIDALAGEIRVRGAELAAEGYVPRVMYWGGGTASDLEEPEILAVMAALRESFDLSGLIESTIECSPDTIGPAKLALFRSLGFNRFSCGVQSFDDRRLRSLGRLHTADEGRDAVRWARDAGFENINVDVMCGFLDESAEETMRTVSASLELGVTHLSLYIFRPTPGTALRARLDRGQGNLVLAEQLAVFGVGRKMITGAGYAEYASGYFGQFSLFSQYYFQSLMPLVGFGSGAMSIIHRRFRTHTKGRLHAYISRPTSYEVDLPASSDPVIFANLRSGLACFDGILREYWEDATGITLNEALARPALQRVTRYFRAQGLIEDERGIRLPPACAGAILHKLSYQLLRASHIRSGAAGAG